MLISNNVLRKLELEGNLLGPQSARAFGKSLKKNISLKVLDLESNQLTQDGQDMQGIYDFVKVSYKRNLSQQRHKSLRSPGSNL